MQLFYCPEILKGETYLNAEESKHCARVLRKTKGDLIRVTDGAGHLFKCVLDQINQAKCIFHIQHKDSIAQPDYSIHIAIAPTKNSERTEWFVEKAVEIGIQEISFVQSAFSERKHLNVKRVHKKAVSAMKQSGRAWLPKINAMTKLTSFVKNSEAQQKFVAHLENQETDHLINLAQPSNEYLVVVGPEGGFSEDEIELLKGNKYRVARIGDYRLRTETAGIVVCNMLNNIN